MPGEHQILRDYLKKNNFKDTAQREVILDYILRADDHVTPEDIFQALRRRDPKIGRATVFRTLKLLEECGLVSHVTFANGQHKYERIHGRPHHDHMICVQCGATIEFSSPAVERIQDQVAGRHKFKILWHRHEIFGRCDRCENRAPARAGSAARERPPARA